MGLDWTMIRIYVRKSQEIKTLVKKSQFSEVLGQNFPWKKTEFYIPEEKKSWENEVKS